MVDPGVIGPCSQPQVKTSRLKGFERHKFAAGDIATGHVAVVLTAWLRIQPDINAFPLHHFYRVDKE